MDPSLVMLRVDLSPAIVMRAQRPHEPDSCAHRAAEHTEAVGPFTNTAPPCLQEGPNIAVPWEALVPPAILGRTLIEFYLSRTTHNLVF